MTAIPNVQTPALPEQRRLKWTPHPYLPIPSDDEVIAAVESFGPEWVLDVWKRREERLARSEQFALAYGFEPPTWADADGLLNDLSTLILAIFGGNRAAKSEYAAKRVCESAMTYPGSVICCLSEKDETSIATQQKLIWKFLKPFYEHLNGKRHAIHKVNYTQANGFADGKLVLTNATEIYFLTYKQEAGDYEGWEFGGRTRLVESVQEQLRAGRVPDGANDAIQLKWWEFCAAKKYAPINVGAWPDESLTLAWLQMFARRLKFRRAKMPWTFTPVKGITPAIKEMVGSAAETLVWRPSELLPRKNLPDGPAGHMPYIRKPAFQKSRSIYFFSEYNLFGGYYEQIKELCEGKASEYVERVAYGFARDSVSRAFPLFGPWNIVKRAQLPAIGTNYMFTDPAGIRNWASLWVRVTPGDKPSLYIYRDWPDAQRYGEWATPTEREVSEENRKGWDGDIGPAQASFGFGISRYKNLFLEEESLRTGAIPRSALEIEATLVKHFPDPYHQRQVKQALKRGDDLTELREEIYARYIDPRAAANEHVAEEGGTCILWMMADEERDSAGKLIAPAMDFIPANGEKHELGLNAVKELLDWNVEAAMVPLLNAPRLFVCEDCLQVRWMMENYTGLGGEKGACKDFADLVRYMALAELLHHDAATAPGRAGGGFGVKRSSGEREKGNVRKHRV